MELTQKLNDALVAAFEEYKKECGSLKDEDLKQQFVTVFNDGLSEVGEET